MKKIVRALFFIIIQWPYTHVKWLTICFQIRVSEPHLKVLALAFSSAIKQLEAQHSAGKARITLHQDTNIIKVEGFKETVTLRDYEIRSWIVGFYNAEFCMFGNISGFFSEWYSRVLPLTSWFILRTRRGTLDWSRILGKDRQPGPCSKNLKPASARGKKANVGYVIGPWAVSESLS